MQNKLVENCKDVCANPSKLVCFGYEIRKQDYEQEKKEGTDKDLYTNLFLKDIQIDTLLRTIITTNCWNGDKMVIQPAVQYYEMKTGEDYKYELRCEDSTSSKYKPFIISSQIEKYNQNGADDEFIMSFLTKMQIGMDKLKQKIKDRWGKGNNKIQFQLTQRGLKMLNNGKTFICKDGNIAQSK